MPKKHVSVSFKEEMDKFTKKLENLGPTLQEQANQAVADMAHSAYAEITSRAQRMLSSTRTDYLSGLSFTELGNNEYLISLEGDWANALEEGFGSYNLTERLLKSQKTVEVGRRSGQPWVQESKKGDKYAYVPFERKPFSKEAKVADMAAAIKQMTATNARGRKQKLTSVFKDPTGAPLEGKVAMGRSDNPLVDNLVKYQKNYKNEKTGKITTQSVYINYRAVSENGKPWIHKGFSGVRAFEEVEKKLVKDMHDIIRTFS